MVLQLDTAEDPRAKVPHPQRLRRMAVPWKDLRRYPVVRLTGVLAALKAWYEPRFARPQRPATCVLAESSQPPPNARIRSTLARSCRVSSVSASSWSCSSAVCEVTTVR